MLCSAVHFSVGFTVALHLLLPLGSTQGQMLPGVTVPTNYIIDVDSSVVSDERVRDGPAEYRVTFTNYWTPESHSFDFPPDDPHWSPPVYASHNCRYQLWKNGRFASTGVQVVAETGRTTPLLEELESFVSPRDNVLSYFVGSRPEAIEGDSVTSSEFICMDQQHPLVSFVSMIAPSPDWFTGLNDLMPVKDGNWYDKLVAFVFPWDAGTDSGSTYGSRNSETIPVETITAFLPVDGVPEAVFVSEASSSSSGQELHILPVGSLTLERLPSPVSANCADQVNSRFRRRRRNVLPRAQVLIKGEMRKRRCDRWVARKPVARCKREIVGGAFEGQTVKDVCRATCLCVASPMT